MQAHPRATKTPWLFLALPLALVGGVVGGVIGSTLTAEIRAPAADGAHWLAPDELALEAGDATRGMHDELARLGGEVEALRLEVTRLRASERAPAHAGEVAASAPVEASGAAFLAEHRDAIVRVIADERAAEAQRREDERKQREVEASAARAKRAAAELGLDAVMEKALAQIYVQERERLEALVEAARAESRRGDPAEAREAFESVRTWRQAELDQVFGPELSQRIVAFEQERVRGQRGRTNRAATGGSGDGRGRGDG